jgi:hypothetical protein
MEEKLPPPEKQKTSTPTVQIKFDPESNQTIKGDISDVIVQTFKMSGDRYTIASSLILNDKMGVILLTTQAPGDKKRAQEMGEFYFASLKNVTGRVVIAEVDNPDAKYQQFKQFFKDKGATQPKIRELDWIKKALKNPGRGKLSLGERGNKVRRNGVYEENEEPRRRSDEATQPVVG